MSIYIAAITLGLLGSFHCIGMCGPIALSLPLGQSKGLSKLPAVLLYNLGRIITYSVFGLTLGLLGSGFVMGGYQQLLSILAGCLILISVLLPSGLKFKYSINAKIFGFFNKVKLQLSQLFGQQGKRSVFYIGLLNGLLPCGLVYAAAAGSLAAGSISGAMFFMIVFGAGTIPVMLSLPLIGSLITLNMRTRIRKLTPFALSLVALLLIFRGLNLGIPYLSPSAGQISAGSCHEKGNTKATVYCNPVKK